MRLLLLVLIAVALPMMEALTQTSGGPVPRGGRDPTAAPPAPNSAAMGGASAPTMPGAASRSADAQRGPCDRNESSRVMIGGMDLDEVRCRMAILENTQAQSVNAITTMQAKLQLATNDLRDATKRAMDADSAAAWLRDCLTKAECVAWATAPTEVKKPE